ncbi:MAG: phage major capsid protein [bacterium]
MVTPNALTAPQYGDLVQTTLRNLGKPKFTDISSRLQKHPTFKNLLRKNRRELESGYGIQFDVMVGQAQSASNVGIGASDNVEDLDVMTQGTADWRNTTSNYVLPLQVVDMNREPARIVNFVQMKRIAAMISLAELLEGNFWGPPVSATDNITPWGINTWVVKSSTEGFNGGAPSGYTTIGLNPTTYPAWQNWTYQYTNVTEEDLIRHWRKACTFTDFEPTVDGIPTPNTGDDYGFYSNYGVIGPAEELLKAQNDSTGNDLAKFDGTFHFRRAPVNWIPYLEADTTNPVYGINWGWIKTYILQGWWLRETNVPVYPGQHTLSAHFIDMTYQFISKNRRCHMVLATGTTYPS